MRNSKHWLVALVLATVLTSAILFTIHNTKVNQQKFDKQVQTLKAQTKAQHDAEVENLKKTINELNAKLQSKAAEKARLAAVEAAKTPAVSKVVQSIVPTAQAATSSHTDWMAAAGISPSDYQYVEFIVQKESGWNPSALNRASGACSLAQSLPCSKIGADWQNPVTALRWANSYVARYGGWAGAYQHWLQFSWY
jgi:peptidoglycan hydrolase CwlO-like protein